MRNDVKRLLMRAPGLMSLLVAATAVTPAHAITSITSRLPSRSSAAYAEGVHRNLADHAAEIETSNKLGFRRAAAAADESVLPPTMAHRIARVSLGMGRDCPFDGDDLVHACAEPLLTADECFAIRTEAAMQMASGMQSSFTMTDTNRDVSLHDLPGTLDWLNSGAFARVATLAARCFPSAVPDAASLYIYRGLIIHYDAAARLTHQPIHRDGALVSCVVPLSERTEYEGGGTYIEPLGQALALERGCALLHPSAVRHAGHRIHSGERWVMVLFLNSVEMHAGEHGRRYRARAQEWFAAEEAAQMAMEAGLEAEAEEDRAHGRPAFDDDEVEEDEDEDEDEDEEDEDEELSNLLLALCATDEQDHEVWYDLGARAHTLGDTAEALSLYEKADALNPHDALLLSNMGVALLELGRMREAFRCYRRALKADPHSINARFNAGELLLETGRLDGLEALLREAPDDAMEDEGLAGLAEELRVLRARQASPSSPSSPSSSSAAAPSGQRGWVPRTREAEGAEGNGEAGYTWRETDSEIEVRVPLPHGIGARDLAVDIGVTTLRVSVAGDERMGGVLRGALLVDDSSWSLEREEEDEEGEVAGGRSVSVLQLDLLKKRATASDAPLWGRLFE